MPKRLLLISLLAWAASAQIYRISTVAGTGEAALSGDGGPAHLAALSSPSAVALDRAGRVYIADAGNRRVRVVDTDRTIRTVAGASEPVTATGIAVDAAGRLYIGGGSELRVVSPGGAMERVATGEVRFENIAAVAAAWDGTLIVADGARLVRIGRDGTAAEVPTGLDGSAAVSDVALGPDGSIYFLAGESLYRIQGSGALTAVPVGLALDADSRVAVDRGGQVYLSSAGRLWKVSGEAALPLAGGDVPGFSGDGGPAAGAQLNRPWGLAIDQAGNVFFADSGNHRVRVLDAPAVQPALAIYPSNGLVDVWPRLTLQWTPVPGAVSYDVQLGERAGALETVTTTASTTFAPPALRGSTTYFWRIVARSGVLPLVSSPVWRFTTSGLDRAPEVPLHPTPANFAMGQPLAVTLTWEGGAASRFEVYFGDNPSPNRVATVESNRYRVEGLRPETTYYWRVTGVNEASQGSATSSALWQFTTAPAAGYPYVISTLAGAALPVADGTVATAAVLELPRRPAIDNGGNLYFIEGGRRVRRIGPDGRLATVFTPASGGVAALATDAAGMLYIATGEYVIRINRQGQRAFVAGQPGRRGFSGDGGNALQALFDGITSIAADRRGTLYIADSGNGRIRAVSPSGVVRTFAGTGTCGEGERTGNAASAPLCAPTEVAVHPDGAVLVYETGRIVKIRDAGSMEPFAGTGVAGYSGDSGAALEAQVAAGGGLAADTAGNVYVCDRDAMVVRRIDPQGVITTIAGEVDPVDGRAFGFAGDGLPATRAKFGFPDGIAAGPDGSLVIADWYNHRLRRIDAGGFVQTVGGSDTAWGDRGAATAAYLFYPTDVAAGGGFVYVVDSYNHRIRRISPNRSIDTIAGTGIGGGRFGDGDLSGSRTGRPAREAFADLLTSTSIELDAGGQLLFDESRFAWYLPNRNAALQTIDTTGTAVDRIDARVREVGGMARGLAGEIYVSDRAGHRVIRLGPDGSVATVAGTGVAGYSGDGGPAILAQLRSPGALSMSPDGDLYVADFGRIRRIGRDGLITTAANEHANGLAHDRAGNLFVTSNRFVYMLASSGQLLRIAGRESAAGSDAEVSALNARIGEARGLAVTEEGEIVFADTADHRVRRLTRNTPSGISIVSGQDQSAAVGAPFAQPVVLQVNGRAGLPVPGVTLRFTSVDRGIVVPASAVTNANGQVLLRPTAGTRAGDFLVQVSSAGLSGAEIRLRVEP